jgi:hypothetical protein
MLSLNITLAETLCASINPSLAVLIFREPAPNPEPEPRPDAVIETKPELAPFCADDAHTRAVPPNAVDVKFASNSAPSSEEHPHGLPK